MEASHPLRLATCPGLYIWRSSHRLYGEVSLSRPVIFTAYLAPCFADLCTLRAMYNSGCGDGVLYLYCMHGYQG